MTKSEQAKGVELFYSYSHKDEKLREKLEAHLALLQHQGIITGWHDRKIGAGREWEGEIISYLNSAAIVLLLVSADFLASRYCYNVEVRQALQRHDSGEARVIPIILRPCDWTRAPFAKLQALPKDGRAITSWRNRDEAYTNIAQGISAAVQEVIGNSISAQYPPNSSINLAYEQKQIVQAIPVAPEYEPVRVEVLKYFQEEEDRCERLVFKPTEVKRRPKGSDVFVKLTLISKRIVTPPKNDHRPGEQSASDQSREEPAATAQRIPSKPEAKRFSRFHHLFRKERVQPPDDKEHLPASATESQQQSWGSVFSNSGLRLIFTGGAGSGKSFSLTQEVRERLSLSRQQLLESPPVADVDLPIFVKASVLAESQEESVVDALLSSLTKSSYSRSVHFRHWWREAFERDLGRRLFIVIDGLDEISEKNAPRFRNLIKELDGYESASVIVSCRTTYFSSREDWIEWTNKVTLELAPLTYDQQLELVGNWFDDDDRRRSLQLFLETNYFARVFCRSPIILTLVCKVHSGSNQLVQEEMAYDSLYKAVSRRLLLGEWRDQRPAWTHIEADPRNRQRDKRLTAIARITWKVFRASEVDNRFSAEEWEKQGQDELTLLAELKLHPLELLNEMLLVGLIVSEGPLDGDVHYSFAHRTLLEYFAAYGLIECESDWIDIIVKHMWCEPRWEEVIRFAASITNSPTELLRAIDRETGPAVTPRSPLQRLNQYLDSIAAYSFGLLVLVVVLLLVIFIWQLPDDEWSRLQQHGTHLSESFRSTQQDAVFQTPLQVVAWRTRDVLEFYSLSTEVLNQHVEQHSGNSRSVLRILLAGMKLVSPPASLVFLLSCFGLILSGVVHKVFFSRTIAPQDDVFRTGLRIQAEIVGLASPGTSSKKKEPIPAREIERIGKQLLQSESLPHGRVYGGTKENFVPENLVLLFGTDQSARKFLNDVWSESVKTRSRELDIAIRRCQSSLKWYVRFLRVATRGAHDHSFRRGDIKSVPSLSAVINYKQNALAERLRDLIENSAPENTQADQKVEPEDVWLSSLNRLLHGELVFEPSKVWFFRLRMETIALYSIFQRSPSDVDLARLNRRLLEDLLDGILRKGQKGWIRFASWWWRIGFNKRIDRLGDLRYVKSGTTLHSALRGLSLLPSMSNEETLFSLLSTSSVAFQLLNAAGYSDDSFTGLDVYAGKIIALTGRPGSLDPLLELCSRLEDYNPSSALAIKELAAIDPQRGIEAAVQFLLHIPTTSYTTTGDEIRQAALEVLRSAEFDEVVPTLSKSNVPWKALWVEVLIPWYIKYNADDAMSFLRKVSEVETLPQEIRDNASANLTISDNSTWFYPAKSLEHWAASIKSHLEKDEVELAVYFFEKSISEYHIDYSSSKVTDALNKIAAACDKRLVALWLGKLSLGWQLSQQNPALARIAGGSNGGLFNRALVQRIKAICLQGNWSDPDAMEIIILGLRFLGELDTVEAREALLTISAFANERRHRWRLSAVPSELLFWITLCLALEKVGGERAFEAIQRKAQAKGSWVLYSIAARTMAKRDKPAALRLLLMGHDTRGQSEWSPAHGAEPDLRAFASACGVRIRRISHNTVWYQVDSKSQDFTFRVPGRLIKYGTRRQTLSKSH